MHIRYRGTLAGRLLLMLLGLLGIAGCSTAAADPGPRQGATLTPTAPVWAMPTPFADRRGERLAAGAVEWVLIDIILIGNVLTPELHANGEFALAEVEVNNHGTSPVVFDRTALLLVDPAGVQHSIDEDKTAQVIKETFIQFPSEVQAENCLGQTLAPGAQKRCRVLFDVMPAHAANSKLELRLSDLQLEAEQHAVVKLEFLGIEPQPKILEDGR